MKLAGETEVAGNSSTKVMLLKAQIVSIRNQKNTLYAEMAEHAIKEIQLRILLELVEQLLGEVKEIENGVKPDTTMRNSLEERDIWRQKA